MLLKLIFHAIMVWSLVVWSLVAVILHCSGVGMFTKWPITDWPWHWSCLCVFWWDMIVLVTCVLIRWFFKWLIWCLE